jgi:hypothetical protein
VVWCLAGVVLLLRILSGSSSDMRPRIWQGSGSTYNPKYLEWNSGGGRGRATSINGVGREGPTRGNCPSTMASNIAGRCATVSIAERDSLQQIDVPRHVWLRSVWLRCEVVLDGKVVLDGREASVDEW